jgi:DNA-binding NarL/FixJ family response regulator
MGIRALLAGDDWRDRAALRCMFSGIHDIAVIGEARASGPLLPTVRRLDPDVMVLAIGADVDEALTTTVDLHARAPRTGLVVLASPQAHADA